MQVSLERTERPARAGRRWKLREDRAHLGCQMALLPPSLVGDGVRVAGRGQAGGDRGVRHAPCVGRHVRHGGGMTRRPSSGRCGRLADLPRRGVCSDGQGASRPDPQLTPGEGSCAVDGIPGA
ncbi:MAG: hypothetical protein K0S97_1398 [Chloroflexota bacterium]|nr:hypothetical protein [Chloroflexota bacterium]